MTKHEQDRIDRLMPGGIPRWIRIWDAGEAQGDRYTVVYCGRYRRRGIPKHTPWSQWPWFQYVGMKSHPFHPSHGVCQHGESQTIIDCPNGFAEQIGRKCRHNPELGRRIAWSALPADCRQIVMRDYCEIWGISIDPVFALLPAKKVMEPA